MNLIKGDEISSKTINKICIELNNNKYREYFKKNGELPVELYFNIIEILVEGLELDNYIFDIVEDKDNFLNSNTFIRNPDEMNFAGYFPKLKKILLSIDSFNSLLSCFIKECNDMDDVYNRFCLCVLYQLGHEVEHANQIKKIDDNDNVEGNFLFFLQYLEVDLFIDNKDKYYDLYSKYYNIIPKEKLANIYSYIRIYLMGKQTKNNWLINVAKTGLYEVIFMGYGIENDESIYVPNITNKSNYTRNSNIILYGPSIVYLSELLNVSNDEALEIFNRFFKDIPIEEKIKLGLLIKEDDLFDLKLKYLSL